MKESGILMHVSSLASPYGIGTMGKEAYEFIDFLNKSKTSIWQVLPIGQTGYGDSPYQSVSSFAGNPYFIDLDMLVDEGLLYKKDLPKKRLNEVYVDYGNMYQERYEILRRSFKKSYKKLISQVEKFKEQNKWLDDYSLFMALKNHFGGVSWLEWDDDGARLKEQSSVEKYKLKLQDDVNFYCYIQYLFYKQWRELRNYANKHNIKICGDMPIYCALDSADVWANSDNFQLSDDKKPLKVAGVPPDYFSEDGQLWGNPLYDWEFLKEDGYKFWVERMKATNELFDIVRLDHFIGFARYYSIDAFATTAKIGEWNEGPKHDLFDKIREEVPTLEIIAEDLGVAFDEVVKLKNDYNFPGMHILTFMLDPNEGTTTAIDEIKKNSIVYTGTHDNDTTFGWWNSLSQCEQGNILKSVKQKSDRNIVGKLIKICFKSRSKTVVIPMQDYLRLGSEARMNTPGVASGNWQFRVKRNAVNDKLAQKIAYLNDRYDRC